MVDKVPTTALVPPDWLTVADDRLMSVGASLLRVMETVTVSTDDPPLLSVAVTVMLRVVTFGLSELFW